MENRTPLLSSRGRNPLGRGLQSLIPPGSLSLKNPEDKSLMMLSVDDLLPGDGQPRQNFDEGALLELAASIKEHGVLQPLVVRRRPGGQYEIVAGERRWRAAKKAGLKTIPCVVSEIANEAVLAVALVENIQREDLNVIEEAESYRRLTEELGLTQDEIAKAVGKDRTTITNTMRLLKLPREIQNLVVEKRMSMGHARALLSLRDVDVIQQIADQISENGISVRRTEALVQEKLQTDKNKKQETGRAGRETSHEKEARRRIEQRLGTRVELRNQKGQGTIVIHFSSVDQLNDLLEQLEGN